MGLQEMEGTQTAEIKVEFIQDTPSRNPVDILFRIDVSSYGTSEDSNRYVVNSYEYNSWNGVSGTRINVPCNVTITFLNNVTTKILKGSSQSINSFTGAELGNTTANRRITRVGTEESGGTETTYYEESTDTNYYFRIN